MVVIAFHSIGRPGDQDALRWGDGRPRATLLLVPDVGETPWLSEEDFVRQNRVGAVTLRPGSGPPDWFWQLFPAELALEVGANRGVRSAKDVA